MFRSQKGDYCPIHFIQTKDLKAASSVHTAVKSVINQLLVIQYLYGKSGPNHLSDMSADKEQLGQNRLSSADTTRLITMTSSPASFPIYAYMADAF